MSSQPSLHDAPADAPSDAARHVSRPMTRQAMRLAIRLLCGLIGLALCSVASAQPAQPAGAENAPPRQRLALVIGLSLDSAPRDSAAVAQALRQGGFEVLQPAAPTADALQDALNNFRARLQPDGTALIYVTGLAAQVDGRNLLLPADAVPAATLTAPAVATVLRAAGLPLQTLLDSLTADLPATRVLIVDAAYRHAALARLAQLGPPGLTRQRVPAGTMLLLGHAPAALQELLPLAPAADPRGLAATLFARMLVDALGTPRLSAPEALRAVRLAVIDASRGLTQPWLAGDTDSRHPLADASRLDALAALRTQIPQTPQTDTAPASDALAPADRALAPLPSPALLPTLSIAEAARRSTDGRTVQAPGRGERPLFQAKANAYGHAEGDVYRYELFDTAKDELLRSWLLAIEQVEPDGQLRANGGRQLLDAEGRMVLDTVDMVDARGVEATGFGATAAAPTTAPAIASDSGEHTRYEPAQLLWWAGAQPGDNRAIDHVERYRRADGTRGRIVWRGRAQVGTARMLETPAGEFEVLPIRSRGEGIDTPEGSRPLGLQPPGSQPAATQPQRRELQRTVWYAPRLGMPVAIDIEDNEADGRPLLRQRIQLTHVQQARTATP